MHSKIDVLIIDDSLFIRSFLSKIFTGDQFGTVKQASNGVAALSLLNSFHPDVITLDIEMPQMNGLETLRSIRSKYDIPIIMVTALSRKGADHTIKALELGATDWIQKPANSLDKESYSDLKDELICKVFSVTNYKSYVRVSKKKSLSDTNYVRGKDYMTISQFKEKISKSNHKPAGNIPLCFSIVGIGVSTGGPSALNKVVPMLPVDLNAAVIIVQHMPATFTQVLANRLDDMSEIKVSLATDNQLIEKGNVYIIPGGKHIAIHEAIGKGLKIKLENYEKVGGFRPSAETLFYYLAETARRKSIGVIMTGMGSDGAENIGLIKAYSGNTIAQDEDSCIVFGMPKVAIKNGNINYIEPLDNIANKIKELVEK